MVYTMIQGTDIKQVFDLIAQGVRVNTYEGKRAGGMFYMRRVWPYRVLEYVLSALIFYMMYLIIF
jgi:hypothetical protein